MDINECVYKGIMNAEYDNEVMEYIYKHPLIVVMAGFAVVFLIAVLLFIIFNSKKREQMRILQDSVTLRLALERTHLCIWKFDIATQRIIQIHDEHEKHGFGELWENIPEAVIEKGYIHPEDAKEVRDVLARVRAGEQDVQGCWRVREMSDDNQNTTYWWEQVLFHIVYNEHHKPITAIGVSEDVTVEKNAQKDALTSVYNRSSFEEKAKSILSERRNSYLQCAFLILDLDGFKQINDTYGHGTGDKVLISVGSAMKQTFRNTDIVGRLGGDETLQNMAIIAITQAGDSKLEKEILSLGIDDFIYKAASSGVIQMRVRNIMKSRGI